MIPVMAWVALGIVLGLWALSLAIGFIWLHYTAEPKQKQNKLDKKEGNTNGNN